MPSTQSRNDGLPHARPIMPWWAGTQRHTVVSSSVRTCVCVCVHVCVCICMSVTRVSRRPLQARYCQVQCRHNTTISQI